MDFNKGIKDGIPIALGYFSVSIAFGIMAVEAGCTWFEAVLISLTNLTSAGQFAGVTVITHMGSFIEMALMQFVVNSRYGLMGIALSQKVNSRFKGIWRIILGFAITDEIFAVAIGQDSQVSRRYFAGLAVLPIAGWTWRYSCWCCHGQYHACHGYQCTGAGALRHVHSCRCPEDTRRQACADRCRDRCSYKRCIQIYPGILRDIRRLCHNNMCSCSICRRSIVISCKGG